MRRFRCWRLLSPFGEEVKRFAYADKARAEELRDALDFLARESGQTSAIGYFVQPLTLEVNLEASAVKA